MNLRSITTLGIISMTMAATSFAPAEANSMSKYLNMVALQNLQAQQAAAAAAAAAPVVTPAPAPVAAPTTYLGYGYYDKSQVDAERHRLVREIYDLNYSLLHSNLSPRAYSRTQAKVAKLQERLTRLNALGT